LTKRVNTMQAVLADPGTGMPIMSIHRALKTIMKMSDSEIKDMFNEIRLEKAMAAELQMTANIIKHTGIFDTVDNIYGDYDAMANGAQTQQQQQQQGGDMFGGGGGGGMLGGLGGAPMDDLGGDMGGDFDMGAPGTEGMPDMGGEPGETGMEGAPAADSGTPLLESIKRNKVKNFTKKYFEMLSENATPKNKKPKSFMDIYFDMISEDDKKFNDDSESAKTFISENNEMPAHLTELFKKIESLVDEDEKEREDMLNEADNGPEITIE